MTQGFLKPRSIEVEPITKHHAEVTMEPFERGFGHTLGNALRRILLSSMNGFAPTEVQITGVVHEYSTLPGVGEDVVDRLLNRQRGGRKSHGRHEVSLTLGPAGPGEVSDKGIALPPGVQLINADHRIATLTHDGGLEMQLRAEKGS